MLFYQSSVLIHDLLRVVVGIQHGLLDQLEVAWFRRPRRVGRYGDLSLLDAGYCLVVHDAVSLVTYCLSTAIPSVSCTLEY